MILAAHVAGVRNGYFAADFSLLSIWSSQKHLSEFTESESISPLLPKMRLLLGHSCFQKNPCFLSHSRPAVLIRKTVCAKAWLFFPNLSKKLFRSAP